MSTVMREMGVRVEQAGQHRFPREIHHRRALRHGDVRADGGDLLAPHKDHLVPRHRTGRRVYQAPGTDRDHGGRVGGLRPGGGGGRDEEPAEQEDEPRSGTDH